MLDELKNAARSLNGARQLRGLLIDCRRLLSERGEANSVAIARDLVVEFQEVVHGRDAAHGRLAVECGVWPMPVVAVQEGLQGGFSLG